MRAYDCPLAILFSLYYANTSSDSRQHLKRRKGDCTISIAHILLIHYYSLVPSDQRTEGSFFSYEKIYVFSLAWESAAHACFGFMWRDNNNDIDRILWRQSYDNARHEHGNPNNDTRKRPNDRQSQRIE